MLWYAVTVMIRYPTLLPLLIVLGAASYYDSKYREVPLRLIAAGTPGVVAGLAIHLIFRPWEVLNYYTLTNVAVVGAALLVATYLLFRGGYVGAGDLPVVALLVVGAPYVVEVYGIRMPLSALSVVLGSVYIVAELVCNVVHNFSRFRVFSELVSDVGYAEKLYYFLVCRVMTGDEFAQSKFYVPVKHPGVRKLVARVGVEPLHPEEYGDVEGSLLAIKGVPFACVIFVGLLLSTLAVLLYAPLC